MKQKLNTYFSIFLLLFFSLSNSYAQETSDWIEQNYPCLKKVQPNEPISENSSVVFIAHYDNSYYVVKEIGLPKEHTKYNTLLPTTMLNEQTPQFNITEHLFTFLITSHSALLQGHIHPIYYGRTTSESKFILDKNKPSLRDYLFDVGSDENGRFLCCENRTKNMALNDDKECGMYTSSGIYGKRPFYIYRYDKRLGNISIRTEEGYGTIYSQHSYIMPEGLTGYTITDANSVTEDLSLNAAYKAGDIVPGQTALLVKSNVKGEFPYYSPSDKEVSEKQMRTTNSSENLLCGTSTIAETTGPDPTQEYKFYKLYYLSEVGDNSKKRLGFFWGAENGGPFKNGANKAYLALPKQNGTNIRGFVLPNDNNDITSIVPISNDAVKRTIGIYSIDGKKESTTSTNELPRGIYIINGNKIIKK